MSKTAKLILSLIGLAAIIVPAILLITFAGKAPKEADIPTGSRQIDAGKLKETVEGSSKKSPIIPSPSPASPAAFPSPFFPEEGSPSSF